MSPAIYGFLGIIIGAAASDMDRAFGTDAFFYVMMMVGALYGVMVVFR